MFNAILREQMCIAVLTGYNPNVFYELAVAQAAARPTIILIEKGQLLPFDIHDLRCVPYDLGVRSFNEKTYINELIAHVKSLEAANWVVPLPFGVRTPLGGGLKKMGSPSGTNRHWTTAENGSRSSRTRRSQST